MARMRIYLDTSVFGGYYDEEFQEASRKFFLFLDRQEVMAVVSEAVARELENAPPQVQDRFRKTLRGECQLLELDRNAVLLARHYVAAGIVTIKYADDALHVAQATLAGTDAIASWNFRHLVNPARIRQFNEINRLHGHPPVVILTPADIVGYLEADHER
jgi:predicted nucleic acid-binding protein